MTSKPSMALAALLAAGAACSLPAAAEPDGQQGMVVVRDAQTGKLRHPSPAEVKALRAQPLARALAAPAATSPVTVRRDGTMHKRLGERGMVYSVVTRDADGKLHDQCVQGAAAADKAVHAPAPAEQKSTGQNEEHRHE
jgi:hypothetical protein